VQTYDELQCAYSYFNERLFNGMLPGCVITLQYMADGYGYSLSQPFVNRDGERTDEISLNPYYFAARTDCGVLSTLVHEMVHLQQSHFGSPTPRYHNREWADWMIQIGLYPSSTGRPGGAETGDAVGHYIVEGGPFEIECERLLASGFHVSWTGEGAVAGSHVPPTSPAVKAIVDSSDRGDASPGSRRRRPWVGLKAISLLFFWRVVQRKRPRPPYERAAGENRHESMLGPRQTGSN
jgi:hypothetical protein